MVGIRVSKVGEKGEGECIACAAVVLATGGFAANRTLLEVRALSLKCIAISRSMASSMITKHFFGGGHIIGAKNIHIKMLSPI